MIRQEHWPVPPGEAELRPDEIHVWLASLDAPPDRLRSLRALLSPEECARADRFFQPHHQVQGAVARACLRLLLGRYLRVEPGSIEFRLNAHGKPALDAPSGNSGVHFNVSHSHGLGLFAFARGREIGVDIERIAAVRPTGRIAERFFAPGEVARLRSVPVAGQARAFFECWTRKEAYVKARGRGLSIPLDSFEVAFGPNVTPALLEDRSEPDASARWGLWNLMTPEGYAGAVAVECPTGTLRCWQFNP